MTDPKPSEAYLRYLQLEAYDSLGGSSNGRLRSPFGEKEDMELTILRPFYETASMSPNQLRRQHSELASSLQELEEYVEGLRYPPFAGDLGMGGSRAMPVRYHAKDGISAVAAELFFRLHAVYVDLVLAYADPEKMAMGVPQENASALLEESYRKRYPEFYRLRVREDVMRTLLKVLEENVDPDALASLSPADGLHQDLGIDSISLVTMIFDLEEAFGTELSCEIEPTVGGLARALEQGLPPALGK